MNAPVPPNEAERLEALRRYAVLDTPPEKAYDDLAMLAAHICGVPMALVSLIDEERQWFKSRVRVDDTWTPRNIAFCAHTILHADDVFVVHDAQEDPRFAASPLVTAGPRIRFYAGAPLVTPEGQVLGALCVMDRAPRTLSPEQVAALQALSRSVVAHLELRKHTVELAKSEQEGKRLLAVTERSRRALLSLLEDEQRAGQSLRESEERFRQITDSIDELFYMTDPMGGALLYISPAYEKIWGRTRASLYDAPGKWAEAIHPEDRERIVALAATKHLCGFHEESYRILRPDGSVRWILDRSFPVKNAAGVVYRLVGVAQDITEKKQLEAQFFRAQRLESIGTLASGIAHDLNNILAPILMATQIIRMGKSPKDSDRMLTMIETSADRGARLVRQLLTFGRGAEGEKQPLRLNPLLKEIAGIAKQTFPKNIAIAAPEGDDVSPILGDATQLHQIFLNLCVNARDAMPQGGVLTILAEDIYVEQSTATKFPGAKPGNHVVVRVADTGTGMTPEVMAKIFDPFFTTKEVGKGTGLGLSTVIGLVKSHGGFLTVDSEPEKGSTFAVYFPVVAKPDTVAPISVEASPRGQGELVLVVDDEESIRDTVRGLLIEQGYTVTIAEDGIEGTSRYALAQSEVKLVITDLDMPNMDGVTMIRVMRLMNPKLKIIVSSGVMNRNQLSASRASELNALGVGTFLDKPYTAGALLRAVHAALAN